MSEGVVRQLRRPRPCPICRKPALDAHRPFCSKRCTEIDLSRWLKGSYRIPAEEEPDPAALAAAHERGLRGEDDEA
jgi:endogenous inhibitor of DNA gyrase (YacG/DUF329 family)